MNTLSACIHNEALIAASIESTAATCTDADIHAGLSSDDNTLQAVAALIAGITANATINISEALIALIDNDCLAGRCATWALGHIPSSASLLISLLEDGSIDQRENAYLALCTHAATDTAATDLSASMLHALDNELQRVARGKSCLGEKACRVLAVLGASETIDALQRVISADQYCDRFEIQRLRKCMDSDGRDSDSISELTSPWHDTFAEDCAEVPAPSDDTAADTDNNSAADNADADNNTEGISETDGEADIPVEEATPIDWEAFISSPYAETLDEQGKAVTAQMGPMLEQLAVRALNKPFIELTSQELVTLVLQVLPQALPPEYMQAALSPPAIKGMKAVALFLNASGITDSDELSEGVRQIRATIQKQIRASGALHGSDYEDEDDNEDNGTAPTSAPAPDTLP